MAFKGTDKIGNKELRSRKSCLEKVKRLTLAYRYEGATNAWAARMQGKTTGEGLAGRGAGKPTNMCAQ